MNAPLPADVRPRTVLLVEDDEGLRDLLRRTLERAGFSVVAAANGKEALKCFRCSATDFVVTDILMPQMDGFELARTLKREAPAVKIVAMSGINDSPNYQRLALDAGATAALSKPVDRAELVKLLHGMAGAQ